MTVDYVYCHRCGFEGIDVAVAAGNTYASGSNVICPECGEETTDFEQYVDDDNPAGRARAGTLHPVQVPTHLEQQRQQVIG